MASIEEVLAKIPEQIDFPGEEEKILSFWNAEKIFENCLKQSKDKPRYVKKLIFTVPYISLIEGNCSDTHFTMVPHLPPVSLTMVIYWLGQLRTW